MESSLSGTLSGSSPNEQFGEDISTLAHASAPAPAHTSAPASAPTSASSSVPKSVSTPTPTQPTMLAPTSKKSLTAVAATTSAAQRKKVGQDSVGKHGEVPVQTRVKNTMKGRPFNFSYSIFIYKP